MIEEIRYVQGEMANWSEASSSEPLAGGRVFEQLVARHLPGGRRVLVVGAHDPAVVARVVDRSRSVVLVLRSRPDAFDAAEQYSGRPVEVICGDASRVHLQEPAEVLLALDGLDRAVSAEATLPAWADLLAHLRSQLTDDATLLLAVPNPLGLPRLAGEWPELRDDDGSWRAATAHDPSQPLRPAELINVAPGAVWSLFPDLRCPQVALGTGTKRGSADAALARVHAGPRGGRLDRPTTLDLAAICGRVDDLAAGWVLVTGVTEVERIAPEAPGRVPDGRVLEERFLETTSARDIGSVRHLVAQLWDTLSVTTAPLVGLTPAEVLIADDGSLHPLRRGDGGTSEPDRLLVDWLVNLAGRISQLGWRHPWPKAAGATEVARLLATSVGLDGDKVPKGAAEAIAAGGADVRPEHLARLEHENDMLRAKLEWFEQAVRHRDAQLASLRHEKSDPRPRLTRKLARAEAELARAEAELVALRESRTFRLGRAMTSPLRAVRERRKS